MLRSIDFGVATINGRCALPRQWWRSRWNQLAGVLGWATVNASSPASCSQRSIRAEEWSGPWPSKPCGSISTTPECWPHLASPPAMNSSAIDCAPLAKSPNCASHITNAAGRATE